MLFFVKPKGKELWLFGEIVLVNVDVLESAGVDIVKLLTYGLMERETIFQASILKLYDPDLRLVLILGGAEAVLKPEGDQSIMRAS